MYLHQLPADLQGLAMGWCHVRHRRAERAKEEAEYLKFQAMLSRAGGSK